LVYPNNYPDDFSNGDEMAEQKKPIIIGADHLGLPLKNILKDYLVDLGYAVTDIGVNDENPVNYPEIAIQLSQRIAAGEFSRGILVCGTGIGMAITANKISGVRAAVIHDPYSAERARASNDAQVATFGSLVIGPSAAKKMLDIWLASEFVPGCKSQPKVDMINALDRKR
jgi:ribose 5-phosphate isomerase B